jgi:hypothetical protein
LGRFVQPDSIIPGLDNSKVPTDSQAWDRFAYVDNSPVVYNDPSGHDPKGPGYCYETGDPGCLTSIKNPLPTLSLHDLINPTPTSGPSWKAATPTPGQDNPKIESQGFNIKVNVNVDWNKVDKVDAIIDAGGIIGEVASVAGPPGKVAYGISEIAEGAGAVKDIYDAFKGDPKNLTKDQIKSDVLNFIPDSERLTPGLGFVMNLLSLGMNFAPATQFNITINY